MMTFLQKKGVTNGIMTRSLYGEYLQERIQSRMMSMRSSQGGSSSGSSSTGNSETSRHERYFRDFDRNRDGKLDSDEMRYAQRRGSRIYDQRETWDKNKNGTIELDEYTSYNTKREVDRNTEREQRERARQELLHFLPGSAPKEPVQDERLTVYRLGKMPKDLPEWYEPIDKDRDGQVGLYEWKSEDKSIKDFLAMDLNRDGFVTAEEVLRIQNAQKKTEERQTTARP
jgi:Ca2+-binding EF-hand superfamily protein